ncbi:hypothetical protein ABZ611_25180 [Streptomyces sp. NPDC007861]
MVTGTPATTATRAFSTRAFSTGAFSTGAAPDPIRPISPHPG